MQDDIKPMWLRMSETRLWNLLLVEKRYPPPIAADIVEAVRRIKAERRASRIKSTVTHNLWDYVLRAARAELGTVRTIKSQTRRILAGPNPPPEAQAKHDALDAYDAVIAVIIERLRKVQQEGSLTPIRFARTLRDAGKAVAGDGTHWTDYVSQRDRVRIEDMFAAVPYPRRGKRKEPFERRISPQEHERLRAVLVGRLVKEQETARQDYEMTTDPDEKERLSKLLDDMEGAHYRLETLSRTAPVPATWHGLLD